MKKRLLMLLALPLMISLAGCGDTDDSVSLEQSLPNVSEPSINPSTTPSIVPSWTPPSTSETPSTEPSVDSPSVSPSNPSEDTSSPSVSTPAPSVSVEPEVPPVNNYGGELELVSATSGQESIHIEGAGVWIWVKSSSIGYINGTNITDYFDLDVTITKGNFEISESHFTTYEHITDRFCVYTTLLSAPGSRDETAFYVKITSKTGNKMYYDSTVEFVGKHWTEEEAVEKIDGGEFELYTDGEGANSNHIEGAGVFVWVKPESVGFTGDNFTDMDVTSVEIVGNTDFEITDAYFSDPSAEKIRVYIVLNRGLEQNDTTTALTFNIKVENATHYYTGTVSFLGTALAE